MDAKVLHALAAEKSLTGADLRVALLLADCYCRPGDLVDASVNRSKSAVSHALRHLQDGGWLVVQDVNGNRYFSLISKLESRRPQRQRKPKKTDGIPGQMSIADYAGADACDADASCIEQQVPAGVDISGGRFA